jgi:MoaA/NifB/PqqE/SkfB family radical SAM enzyme
MSVKAAENNQERPLFNRFVGLIRRNPNMLVTMGWEAYRHQVGINLNRRFFPTWSPLPGYLHLNLTRRCNLKCRMCIQHRQDDGASGGLSWYDPARELPLEVWINLLDQFKGFRPRLYVTGGEPLLYRHFPEFLLAAKKRGFVVNLQTNGIRLAEAADFLVDLGVELINISVDGPQEAHDLVRGKSAFRRTVEGIRAVVAARRKLKRPGPLLFINSVICKDTLKYLDQMVPLALDLEADFLHLLHTDFNSSANVAVHNRLLSPEFAQVHGLDLISPSLPEGEYYQSEISREDLPQLLAGVEKARSQARGRIKLIFHPELPRELIEPYYFDLKHPFPQKCNSLWKTCRILPDGTVSPCLHMVMGNIKEQSFREIWNGPRMQHFRRVIARRLFPGCARCCSRVFS